ncbi:MAG: hypothetical protein M1819_007163 [Sarea resinae]|nr:MAG: hypothetical protein M1819_007163 [Sarea resinae]
MRQRITYLYNAEGAFDPEQLSVTETQLSVQNLDAAKEHRITVGFEELPQELRLALRQCHELHLRWASSEYYKSIAPFVSRVSPGLHVFFTPRRNVAANLLCPILKRVFGDELACRSPETSFSSLPVLSERFASSSASQYYELVPSNANLIEYIQHNLCGPTGKACRSQASLLQSACYVDIDYDTISHALVLNAFWAASPDGKSWNETIGQEDPTDKIEVGILANEKATEPEELSLGGFLTVIGEDTKPNPTLFSFPARHHPLPPSTHGTTYAASFPPPTGLHPTLRLTFPTPPTPPPTASSCALHTYLTLPQTLFVDKYQLSDPLFLASKNLSTIRSLTGETDLEAPTWVLDTWGSALLLELATPPAPPPTDAPRIRGHAAEHTVDVPLHLRYLPPAPGGYRNISIPSPHVFWACIADEGSKMSVNPFDRVNVGYDGLFGPRTMFYHLEPSNTERTQVGESGSGSGSDGEALGTLVQTITVPVLDAERVGWVKPGTMGVVVLGFLWICWVLLRVVRNRGRVGKGATRRSHGKKDN